MILTQDLPCPSLGTVGRRHMVILVRTAVAYLSTDDSWWVDFTPLAGTSTPKQSAVFLAEALSAQPKILEEQVRSFVHHHPTAPAGCFICSRTLRALIPSTSRSSQKASQGEKTRTASIRTGHETPNGTGNNQVQMPASRRGNIAVSWGSSCLRFHGVLAG